jgi:hypothetical protein
MKNKKQMEANEANAVEYISMVNQLAEDNNTNKPKKQTAVEFLESIIFGDEKFSLSEVFNKAKAMEKEQIIDCFMDASQNFSEGEANKYYKETYE